MYSPIIWVWAHIPCIFYKLKQVRRGSHKCKKLQHSTLVLAKGLMLSVVLDLRRGYRNEDHTGV